MSDTEVLAEEIHCECGSLIQAIETACSTYHFSVSKEEGAEEPYIEFGEELCITPIGDTVFECCNPDCHKIHTHEEIFDKAREDTDGV